ncbi:pentapeptide repeat-containing protein [Actinocorallia aurea]
MVLAVLGPGAQWWVEHVDKVPLHGKDAVTGADRQDVLDNARGRLAGIAASLLAATAIFYTAANAASARRTAEAAFKAAESSEQTTRASIHSAEAAMRTAAATERGLVTGRFTAAVEQLGSNKAPVELGGVHALAGIADDEPSMRQTCIDVLCAYLRLPYEPDPGDDPAHASARMDYRAFREVRHTIIRLIGNHLRLPADHPRSWQGHDFDFTDVVFDGGDLHGARFSSGTINFIGAKFSSGLVSFAEVEFCGASVNFARAEISGRSINFSHAKISGGTVNFSNAKISYDFVSFWRATVSGGWINFWRMRFSGGTVSFHEASFSGGRVVFAGPGLPSEALKFTEASFLGGTVDLTRARFFDGDEPPAGIEADAEGRWPAGVLMPTDGAG